MKAQDLFETLVGESRALGRRLNREEWIKSVQKWLDGQKPKRQANILGKGLTDAEWLQSLTHDPLYAGVDIAGEALKCARHFQPQGITPSRKRILGWLARADVKTTNAQAATPKPNLYNEPESWREAAKKAFPGTVVFEAQWFDLGVDTRARILAARLSA